MDNCTITLGGKMNITAHAPTEAFITKLTDTSVSFGDDPVYMCELFGLNRDFVAMYVKGATDRDIAREATNRALRIIDRHVQG